ncbi:MAG: hypothetical protein JOZ52_08320, partial [Acidobacteria bacterium]|nr:hypothetical protein [Acidobacteriota bacterium]
MRKRLLVVLLGVAFAAASMLPLFNSAATHASGQKVSNGGGVRSERVGLPNYDIRLVNKGEFADIDLNSNADTQRAAQNGSETLRQRASAVDGFRATLNPEAGEHLRAQVNEAGAMKQFFVEGASLTEPRADTADNIARGFLAQQPELFALSSRGVSSLKLIREDNDRGTTFLRYAQTVGGIKVFEGEVQVVVNQRGEVTNVREGFILGGQKIRLTPALNESQGIAKAFEHAGRTVAASFVETQSRASQSEFASFANPLSANYEDVLSELNVLRVGDAARLAWHVYAEVGSN